jgi:hypothetical protein
MRHELVQCGEEHTARVAASSPAIKLLALSPPEEEPGKVSNPGLQRRGAAGGLQEPRAESRITADLRRL